MLTFLLQGCMYDLRTPLIKKEGITTENSKKGKSILQKAWEKQGFDRLKEHQVYSYHGSDTWQGLLGKMAQIWPDMKSEIDFKYQVGTFDGRASFSEGKRQGVHVGIQNWI